MDWLREFTQHWLLWLWRILNLSFYHIFRRVIGDFLFFIVLATVQFLDFLFVLENPEFLLIGEVVVSGRFVIIVAWIILNKVFNIVCLFIWGVILLVFHHYPMLWGSQVNNFSAFDWHFHLLFFPWFIFVVIVLLSFHCLSTLLRFLIRLFLWGLLLLLWLFDLYLGFLRF